MNAELLFSMKSWKWSVQYHFWLHNVFFFLRFYLFFRERGREGEKHQCVRETLINCLLHAPPPETCNPGMCPDQELNQRPFSSQASTQPSEPHQPQLHKILNATNCTTKMVKMIKFMLKMSFFLVCFAPPETSKKHTRLIMTCFP